MFTLTVSLSDDYLLGRVAELVEKRSQQGLLGQQTATDLYLNFHILTLFDMNYSMLRTNDYSHKFCFFLVFGRLVTFCNKYKKEGFKIFNK